ncbi:hypothetical protein [Enterococcus avium]|uniref:hypothetical protein n=1 Tax=Enterococcus avium TaxID=33945 RepID=UPI0021A8C40F|nr:hypothetical protein [Enterococcus avium]
MVEVKEMIDLKLFAEEVLGGYECSSMEGKQKMITFLEDNNWFGSKPVLVDGKVMLTSDQVKLYSEPLKIFFAAQSSKVNYDRLSYTSPSPRDLYTARMPSSYSSYILLY